ASGADRIRRDPARAHGRLQLEGRAGGRAALAGTIRQPLLAGAGRLRGPLCHRLGHLRRARDVPGRRRRHRALEARRADDRGEHPRRAGPGAGGGGRQMRVFLLALLLALLPGVAAAQAVQDPAPLEFVDAAEEERFRNLVAELRCVMCQNQSLSDSNAQIAHDLRREVLALMRRGMGDDEIRDFLVARYGEFVLYRPRVSANTWLLWFGPGLLLLAGAFVVARIVRRRSAGAGRELPPDDGQEW